MNVAGGRAKGCTCVPAARRYAWRWGYFPLQNANGQKGVSSTPSPPPTPLPHLQPCPDPCPDPCAHPCAHPCPALPCSTRSNSSGTTNRRAWPLEREPAPPPARLFEETDPNLKFKWLVALSSTLDGILTQQQQRLQHPLLALPYSAATRFQTIMVYARLVKGTLPDHHGLCKVSHG